MTSGHARLYARVTRSWSSARSKVNEVKEPLLQGYYHTVDNSIAKFDKVVIEHICRQDNERADALSCLATTKKQSHHWSVVQIHLKQPSVGDVECLAITKIEAQSSNIWRMEPANRAPRK